MRNLFHKLCVGFILFMVTGVAGCGGGGNTSGSSPFENKAVISNDTVQIDTDVASKIVAFSNFSSAIPGQQKMIFAGSSPQITSLQVGQPILIGVTPETPNGFIGKVSSVENDLSGNAVVITEPAALNEVFETLSVKFRSSLTRKTVASVVSKYSKRSITQKMTNLLESISDSGTFTHTFDLSPDPNIKHDVTIGLTSDYSLDIDIKDYTVNSLNFSAAPVVTLTDDIGAKAKITLPSVEKTLAVIKGTSVPIPGTPLVIVPMFTLYFNASGKIEAAASISTTREVQYSASMSYNGVTWDKSVQIIADRKFTGHEIKAAAHVQAVLSPQLDLLINGMAGPFARFDFTGKVTVAPCSDPWLIAEAGATASIGARIRWTSLSHEFSNIILLPLSVVDQSIGPFPYTGIATGLVTDGMTKVPLSGVNITITDASGHKTNSSTNSSGIYSAALCPCTFQLAFLKHGYPKATITIDDIIVDKVSTHNVVMSTVVDHIKVNPANATVNAGEILQLTVTAYADPDETVIVPTVSADYTWIATGGKGAISSAGLFTAGTTAGSATVTTIYNGNPTLTSTATINISIARYRDCGNGTIADTYTNVLWLKNGNCFGRVAWPDAQSLVGNLASPGCGLSDGSKPGDWQLASTSDFLRLYDGPSVPTTWMLYPVPFIDFLQWVPPNYLPLSPSPSDWLNSNGFENIQPAKYWTLGYVYYYADLGAGGILVDLSGQSKYVLALKVGKCE